MNVLLLPGVAAVMSVVMAIPGLRAQTADNPSWEGTLDSVIVTAPKPVLPTSTSVTTLFPERLDRLNRASLGTTLQSVPGVSLLQTGATLAKPVIHGLHSNRILILNNGIRQEGQKWGSEHAPEIDPYIANRITVIKGAEALRFGPEAMGGVVIVTPPALNDQRGQRGQGGQRGIKTELNLAAASNGRAGTVSGMLEGGSGPAWGWRVQGTLRRAGNFRSADYFMENTGLRESNFSLATGYRAKKTNLELYFSHFSSEIGIFQGAHIGNTTDLEARIENGRPPQDGAFSYQIGVPRQRIRHSLLTLKSAFEPRAAFRIHIQYGFQQNRRREYDLRRGGRSGIPSMDLSLYTHTLDASLEHATGGSWKDLLGFSGLLQVNNTEKGTFATPLIPNFDSHGWGVYLIRRFIKEPYELEAGLRYDYTYRDALGYDEAQRLYGGTRTFRHLSASLGGIYRPASGWDLRTNLGLAWRPPAINELYSKGLHHGTAAYELGDSTLAAEKGIKWITSAAFRGNRLSFELSPYLHWLRNFVSLHPTRQFTTTMQGSFPTFAYRQSPARFSGLDLDARYGINRALEYSLDYSLVRARDPRSGDYLPWIPSDRLRNALTWQYAGYRKGLPALYLTLQHEWVARQTRYQPERDFAPPPRSYHLWNLEGGTRWSHPGHELLITVSVQNLGNTLYRDYMNRLRYYAHDKGRDIRIQITYRTKI